MADREALERELEELRERLSREDRLRARREDLSRQAEELRERKAALGEVLAKEEADVDALEGMSLQAILQTVLGRKEERLEQERREAVAARLRYQDACRAWRMWKPGIWRRRASWTSSAWTGGGMRPCWRRSGPS